MIERCPKCDAPLPVTNDVATSEVFTCPRNHAWFWHVNRPDSVSEVLPMDDVLHEIIALMAQLHHFHQMPIMDIRETILTHLLTLKALSDGGC